MSARTGVREVIIGPAAWRHGATPVAGDRFMTIRLPDGPADVNTLYLSRLHFAGAPFRIHERGGGVVGEGRLTGYPLPDLAPTSDVSRQLAPHPSLSLLFAVVSDGQGGGLFVQIRQGGDDVLFVRAADLPGQPLADAAPAQRAADLLDACWAAAEVNRRLLNNHQYYYRKFWPGEELEHKLTLPDDADVYGLAVTFRNMIGGADFEDYIWEYGDIFQQWDFDNHLYEVSGPSAEVGYVSFIPDSRGSYVVKRKWFLRDGFRRREQKWLGVDIDGSFDAYLRDHVNARTDYLGSFRRTRFDVSCESVRSGNVHAIMIDRCRVSDPGGPDLCQVEIEYLHSRTVRDEAAATVEEELDNLACRVGDVLAALGVAYRTEPLSKLSYLRGLRDGLRTA